MQTRIFMAGLNIQIDHLYHMFADSAKDYLTEAESCDFAVSVTEDDLAAEQIKTAREYILEGKQPLCFPPEVLEVTAVHRKIAERLPQYDAVVFHGSVVAVGEKACLFTAKSGVGKTTHSRLWLQEIAGSYIVNGDKPVLRVLDGKVMACGTPWRGKEGLGCSRMVPVEAVCLLGRGEENSIREISFAEALPVLIEQTYRSAGREVMDATLGVLKTIGQSVRFYRLSCNMEPEAAHVAYEGICL